MPPSVTTFEELVQQEPPVDRQGVRGRKDGADDRSTTAAPRGTRSGSGRHPGADSYDKRPNYFLLVTVPWTAGMLVLLAAFLFCMRTNGRVYRVLTHTYEPPPARQQVAEERRRERLEETERTAQNAWESERARWRAQRSSRSFGSGSQPAGSSAASVPTVMSAVSWADLPHDGGAGTTSAASVPTVTSAASVPTVTSAVSWADVHHDGGAGLTSAASEAAKPSSAARRSRRR